MDKFDRVYQLHRLLSDRRYAVAEWLRLAAAQYD